MAAEKFCLKWNEFEANIGVAFRELRDDKDFFDVTLACEDEQLQAHKVILSACSPFFRMVLRRNPHAHPLLYLRGVGPTNLKAILDFMYHGEVNVLQENLNSFLAVAEELKVKGLTQNLHEEKSPPATPPDRAPPAPARKAPQQPPALHHALHQDDEPLPRESLVKTEPQDTAGLSSSSALLLYQEYEDEGRMEEQAFSYGQEMRGYSSVHKQRLIEYVERVEEEGGVVAYKCSICQKTSTRRDALTSHIENIHFPGAYKCYYCDLVFNSQNTRNVHIGRKHKFNTNSLGPSALPQLPSSASLQLPSSASLQLPAPSIQLPAPTLQLPAPQIN